MLILKEKLKKAETGILRVWNKEMFGDLNITKQKVILNISALDKRDEDGDVNKQSKIEKIIVCRGKKKKKKFKKEGLKRKKYKFKWLGGGTWKKNFFIRKLGEGE